MNCRCDCNNWQSVFCTQLNQIETIYGERRVRVAGDICRDAEELACDPLSRGSSSPLHSQEVMTAAHHQRTTAISQVLLLSSKGLGHDNRMG